MLYKKGLYIIYRRGFQAPMPPALFETGADLRTWATNHGAKIYPISGVHDFENLQFTHTTSSPTPMPDWPLVTVYADEPEATYKLTSRTFSQSEKDDLGLPAALWEQVT